MAEERKEIKSVLRSVFSFIWRHKKWTFIPIIIIMLFILLFVFAQFTSVLPFEYEVF